jgi:hypothetical protein
MRTGFLLTLAATLAFSACSRNVQTDLQIVDVRTGWYDVGLVNGENKLVPSVAFKLKNVSDTEIGGVQLNAVFRDVGDADNRGEHFVPAISSDEPLAPNATTREFVLRSQFGYTGTEPRQQMLKNSAFVDRRVIILGKHGRNNWAQMGEYPITRELLTE